MGTWGAGLYSAGMALDLRATIGALLRLPFDEQRIVQVLCDGEQKAASDPQDEDHTTFWLVLADQFAKRGLVSDDVRAKALDIIDNERDLTMLAARGMKESDLRKRATTLQKLRGALSGARRTARRSILKAPLPYTLEVGTLYACPVRGSAAINTYRGRKDFDGSPWVPDGFRQFIVLARDKAFGYLPWYQPIVTIATVKERPTLANARDELWWRIELPKTCSERSFKVMEIEAIGAAPIDLSKVRTRFPYWPRGRVFFGIDGRVNAVNDVGIGDTMVTSSHDWADLVRRGTPPTEGPTVIRTLDDILSDAI
ncbi:MAG TPA: hypothetical protein VNM46_15915 [Xanthobacteraceae bacterium]|nr:hypothetical protein [Xanthobacteraceae bacterium]